jgi:hypothetical protein
MSITALTIVTGDPDSRNRLIGEAIADHITAVKGETCAAIAVTQKDQAPWFRYVSYCNSKSLPEPKYIILVSSNGHQEEWMQPWLDRYGPAQFRIHITREESLK